MDLTEFLTQRIAEDEAAALAASNAPWTALTMFPTRSEVTNETEIDGGVIVRTPSKDDADVDHIARHDPARVLAECRAKRAIVERYALCVAENERNRADHDAAVAAGSDEFNAPDPALYTPIDRTRETSPFETAGLEFAVRSLALPYADHPDFQEQWRA